MGEAAFGDWGWRIPFLLSAILLAVSLWIRLKLNELPLFKRMVDEGKQSKRPLAEAFGQWSNAKIAILALFGATAGEAVVWYGGQFYALFFLTQTLKVPGVTAQIMVAIALAIGTPCFILFGWLSDKIGRKPIMLAGFALAVVTYFPIFQGITHFANPKLEHALAAAPVTVTADPSQCSFQFKATGTEKFTTPCDVIKAALVGLSVNYENVAAPAGTVASVKIGEQTITGNAPDAAKAIAAAIKAHGYPAKADPNDINYVMTVVLLTILVIYVPWCTGRSPPGWSNCSRPASAIAGCRSPITSATAGSAASCRRPCSPSWQRPGTSIRVSGTRSGCSDELCRWAHLPARDQGPRYHPHLTQTRVTDTAGGHFPSRFFFARFHAASMRGVALDGSALLQKHLAEMSDGMGQNVGLVLFRHEG